MNVGSIYLGGAIDLADQASLKHFEDTAKIIVDVFGDHVVIFNPLTAFKNANKCVSPSNDQFIVDINNQALFNADIGCFVWSSAQSFGVPIEIFSRAEREKPIIIYNVSGKPAGIYMRHVVLSSHPYSQIVHNEQDFINLLTNFKTYKSEWEVVENNKVQK